jgi:hypothetical protein
VGSRLDNDDAHRLAAVRRISGVCEGVLVGEKGFWVDGVVAVCQAAKSQPVLGLDLGLLMAGVLLDSLLDGDSIVDQLVV